jgi:hypothetical protein
MEVPSNEHVSNTESSKLDTNTTSPTSETLTKTEKSSSSQFLNSYRDILIMEERLKYNWKLSKYRQRQILCKSRSNANYYLTNIFKIL